MKIEPRSHHHLTPSERVEIYKLFTQENCSRGEIARVHPSFASVRRKSLH
ncbi:helix-turn-helix domain-containing protein [Geitlerinema sp. CS-897]|nr:helix-turn-helix domain-containing protein [Geitlerinema sp. CS-897]